VNTPVGDHGVEVLLSDPASSTWLKRALQDCLQRDPADALNDVLALAGVLEARLRRVFDLGDQD
jgi:hypothetical protein